MKLRKIVQNEKALKTLEQVKLKHAQAAWDMAEAIEAARKNLKKYYDNRNDLILKHGAPKEEGSDEYKINDLAGFDNDLTDLLDVNVDLAFPTLLLDDLNGEAISPADIIGWKDLGIIQKGVDDGAPDESI